MNLPPSDVTQILNGLSSGEDLTHQNELLNFIYQELRAMASKKMIGERAGHTLQPTALVNEAFMRLSKVDDWQSRRHFFGAASEAMRRILVDAAKRRLAAKRGAGQTFEEFDEQVHLSNPHSIPDERVIAISDALDRLEGDEPDLAQMVKLRFYVGLSNVEIGELLDVHERTVQRWWDRAKISIYRLVRAG